MNEITLYHIADSKYNSFRVGTYYFLLDRDGNGFLGQYKGNRFKVSRTTDTHSEILNFIFDEGEYRCDEITSVLEKFAPINIHKTKY